MGEEQPQEGVRSLPEFSRGEEGGGEGFGGRWGATGQTWGL